MHYIDASHEILYLVVIGIIFKNPINNQFVLNGFMDFLVTIRELSTLYIQYLNVTGIIILSLKSIGL